MHLITKATQPCDLTPTKLRALYGYLKLKEVCDRYGVGKTWVYDNIKNKSFPAPKKLGCMSRWSSDDLLQWEIQNGLRDEEQEAEAC